MSVFHSKFVHDDRLLMNHVQEQHYPKPYDTSLTMDSSLLVLDLLLRFIVSRCIVSIMVDLLLHRILGYPRWHMLYKEKRPPGEQTSVQCCGKNALQMK
uniref:Uncharacterized protein n=1 Tax=Setaria italica TaxID=4555 RepID=K3ZB51_SETIT